MAPSSPAAGREATRGPEAALVEYHRRLSLERFLARLGVPRWGFVMGASAGLPALWVLADHLFGTPIATPSGLPLLVAVGLSVVASAALYIDHGLPTAIVRVGDVVAEPPEYYRLMTEFVRTLYRPGTRLLWLFLGVFAPILGALLVGSGAATPVDVALVVTIAAVSAAVLSAYTWVTVLISVYMWWKLRTFTVRLDVTRSNDHLGLQPYSEFVFRALFINMVGYSLVAAYALVFAFTSLLFLFLLAGTGFAVLWFVGSQYGLHRAIVRSKRRRLAELREAYGDEVHGWFALGEPNPTLGEVRAADQFLNVKREIEEIPEWPSSNVQFVRAAGIATAANAIASLPVFL